MKEDHSPAVKSLTCRVHHILSNRGTNKDPLCIYTTKLGIQAVTPENMIILIFHAVKSLNLHKQGIDPDLVG
eukprot:623675-Ditylum_brightwellii.AAC.1